jgi:hypothetical protein
MDSKVKLKIMSTGTLTIIFKLGLDRHLVKQQCELDICGSLRL